MKEKNWLFFGTELLVTACGMYEKTIHKPGDITELVFIGLLFACAVAGKLLLAHFQVSSQWIALINVFCLLGCFAYGLDNLFALAAVLIVELADRLAGRQAAWGMSGVSIALLWLLFPSTAFHFIMTLLAVLPLCYSLWLTGRLAGHRKAASERQEESELLRSRIQDDQKRLQTLEYAARLEERNRLAARIHDKIGHGVSGSIILLEAALLNMPDKPEAVKKTIEQAVDGLRASVDDIRLSLREERASHTEAGVGEIKAELAKFSQKHAIKTQFKQEGRLELITPAQWKCICENMLEALTNFLKHANATLFHVGIRVENKLIHVEFRDNGQPGAFEKGMGLLNMEERTALFKGRCFFKADSFGFHINQIFRVEQE